ncbi:MAG: hypothetical protein MZV64_72355 [Ignavibacteriales bacterium]|nr:hypothetical protein [Ignavibacteriales bacterium]
MACHGKLLREGWEGVRLVRRRTLNHCWSPGRKWSIKDVCVTAVSRGRWGRNLHPILDGSPQVQPLLPRTPGHRAEQRRPRSPVSLRARPTQPGAGAQMDPETNRRQSSSGAQARRIQPTASPARTPVRSPWSAAGAARGAGSRRRPACIRRPRPRRRTARAVSGVAVGGWSSEALQDHGVGQRRRVHRRSHRPH